MCLRSSNSLHSILESVLCSRMKQYWLKFHATGQLWIRVKPCGMVQPIAHNQVETETRYHVVWFSQSQWLCSKWRIKMAVPTKLHRSHQMEVSCLLSCRLVLLACHIGPLTEFRQLRSFIRIMSGHITSSGHVRGGGIFCTQNKNCPDLYKKQKFESDLQKKTF